MPVVGLGDFNGLVRLLVTPVFPSEASMKGASTPGGSSSPGFGCGCSVFSFLLSPVLLVLRLLTSCANNSSTHCGDCKTLLVSK